MIIKCEKIVKTSKTKYHTTQVFNGASIEIRQGDYVAITGRSGSGKTTLLNILGFLDKPDSGVYFFNGKKVEFTNTHKLNKLRRENVAFVRQDYGLINVWSICREESVKGLPLPGLI